MIRGLWRLAFIAVAMNASCGYQSVYARGPRQRVHVRLVRESVPDAVAADEVLAGAREEFARWGALEPGDGVPYAALEVVRAEEGVRDVAVSAGRPLGRTARLGVVARAWVICDEGDSPVGETGDVVAEDNVDEQGAPGGVRDPSRVPFDDSDAWRAAARRLGRQLAAKLLSDRSVETFCRD